jgi:hypothetical protein
MRAVPLRSRSCIIDGEAVACGDDGIALFERIRYRRHDASVFMWAFDIIELNGEQQINADHHRLIADRVQAEQLLEADLTNYAEGMAAAWCLLVALSEQTTDEAKTATREATAYMARQLSRADRIANYRAMSNILGWDRRVSYIGLIDRLDDLRQFSDADEIHDPQEVLGAIRHLADQFELCLPNTSHYFDGLWRRSPKAMSFADYVRYIGGVR